MTLTELLTDKDNTAAYRFLQQLEAESERSDDYYDSFDEFLAMISDSRSYVRIRGVRMCCAQARWDTLHKLEQNLETICTELKDDRPTAVRQCLAALHTVLRFQPQLGSAIAAQVSSMDTSQYKDTLRPLIEKDRIRLLAEIKG